LKLHRRQTYAGFLIVSLIALLGFAAFSARSLKTPPPVEIPAQVSARVAGQLLGVDLGPDTPSASVSSAPAESAPDPGADDVTEANPPDG